MDPFTLAIQQSKQNGDTLLLFLVLLQRQTDCCIFHGSPMPRTGWMGDQGDSSRLGGCKWVKQRILLSLLGWNSFFFSSGKHSSSACFRMWPARQTARWKEEEGVPSAKCLENKELLSAFPQSSTPSPGLLLHLACLQARSFEHERPLV